MVKSKSIYIALSFILIQMAFLSMMQTTAAADAGTKQMVRSELIFGLNKPGGQITIQEFDAFVDEFVTPRFRDGLTIIPINGQYMGESGEVLKEQSRMILIFHEQSDSADQSLEFIREKYKKIFDQYSVIRISSMVDVSF